METGFAIAVVLVVVLALVIRLASGSWDRDRIRQYIDQRGGQVVDIQWAPFGRGWFGEKGDRIYEVQYKDADGIQHLATCKTSMWTGVYWTEDKAVTAKPQSAPEQTEVSQLRAENERLRQELERLKQQPR